ncbi:hypothetical protein QUF90_22705 [Desulfococcaceae bacterium HSG9]|nr:hypothetical protein [Desulfococcaceae bacterium HSG9]
MFLVKSKFRVHIIMVWCPGVIPSDALADFPERGYSCLLQEQTDTQIIRDSFKELEITLSKLSGLKVSYSRLEVINRDTGKHYDKFYEEKNCRQRIMRVRFRQFSQMAKVFR